MWKEFEKGFFVLGDETVGTYCIIFSVRGCYIYIMRKQDVTYGELTSNTPSKPNLERVITYHSFANMTRLFVVGLTFFFNKYSKIICEL